MTSLRRFLSAVAVAAVLAACSDSPSAPPSQASVQATPGVIQSPAPESTPTGSANAGQPEPAPAEPTSAGLIEAAVEAGTIDAATGLLYRIYATFGDPRLPPAYSTGEAREDIIALMRAGADVDSLPADIAAKIRPYLARPTDPTSPFHVAATSASTGGAQTVAYHEPTGAAISSAATCDQRLGWAWLDGTNWIRVWAPCGSSDEAALPQVLAVADAMYSAEKAYLGGRLPVEDEGGRNQGWETRLDLYLVSSCAPRSAGGGGIGPSDGPACLGIDDGITPGSSPFPSRGGVRASSAFVLINRSVISKPNKLKATLAHELFHVYEYSYNHFGFLSGSGNEWVLDASATWAEWQFANTVPTSSAGPIFGTFQGSKISLQDDLPANGYLSFGWPLFLEQHRAGTVRTMWEAIEGKNGDAIMDAINGVLSFDDNFRVFGMRGWNREIPIASPVTPWLDAPPVSSGGHRIQPFGSRSPASIDLVGTDKGATPRSLPGDSPSLWAHYQHFKVEDTVGQVVLDFSGVKPGSRLDVDALVKIKGRSQWERRDLPDGKSTWCIDNPDDAIEEFVVVLSNHAHKLAETLTGKWTVESPKEPCLSYHIRIDWTDTWNGNPDEVIFDGYADTINDDALGGAVMLTGEGTYNGDRDGYLACNPGLADLPKVSQGKAVFQAVIVGDRVTVSAFADYLTDFSGVQTYPFEGPREGTTNRQTGAYVPIFVDGGDKWNASDHPDPLLCLHGYYGQATIDIKIKPPP
jgi:hypothetical protein